MSEFKPLHDVSKSGRMAFAAGPEGECVAVFDVVRWLLYSGAACNIREAIDGALRKLHEAVASGCVVYQASPAGYWAQPVTFDHVARAEKGCGLVKGAALRALPAFDEEAVWIHQYGPSSTPWPAGAVALLNALLVRCNRLDTFDMVTTTHKAVPHFGIAHAEAVALFGYPPLLPAALAASQVPQACDTQAAVQSGDNNPTDPDAIKRDKALEIWGASEKKRGEQARIARQVGATPRRVGKWIEAESKRLAKLAKEGRQEPNRSDGAALADAWRHAA